MADTAKIDSLKIELDETKDKFELEIDKLRESRNQEIEKRRKLIFDECKNIFDENEDLIKEVYGLTKFQETTESKTTDIKTLKQELMNIICKNSKRLVLIKDCLLKGTENHRNTTLTIGVNQKGFGYLQGEYREKFYNDFNNFIDFYIVGNYYYDRYYSPEDIQHLRELCIATFQKFAKEKGRDDSLIQMIPLLFENNPKVDREVFKMEIGLDGDNKLVLDRYDIKLKDVAENENTQKEIRLQDEFSTSRDVDYYLDLNFFSQYKEKIIQAIKDKRAEIEIKNLEIDRIHSELSNMLIPYRALKEI